MHSISFNKSQFFFVFFLRLQLWAKFMKQCQEIKPNWIWSENFDISFCVIFYHLAKKKVVLFPQIDRAKIFSSLTRPHSWMYIRIYIFCFKQKNIHRNNKQKKLNKIEKQKKPTKTGRKKILLSLTIFVNNKSNGIRWNRLTICSAYF